MSLASKNWKKKKIIVRLLKITLSFSKTTLCYWLEISIVDSFTGCSIIDGEPCLIAFHTKKQAIRHMILNSQNTLKVLIWLKAVILNLWRNIWKEYCLASWRKLSKTLPETWFRNGLVLITWTRVYLKYLITTWAIMKEPSPKKSVKNEDFFGKMNWILPYAFQMLSRKVQILK